jgi:hypothetical protein
LITARHAPFSVSENARLYRVGVRPLASASADTLHRPDIAFRENNPESVNHNPRNFGQVIPRPLRFDRGAKKTFPDGLNFHIASGFCALRFFSRAVSHGTGLQAGEG